MNIVHLKKRSDFLRVSRKEFKVITSTLIVQIAQMPQKVEVDLNNQEIVRVGFTASRKIGKAVLRNRARRRMRALVMRIFPRYALSGQDVVLIARSAIITAPFDILVRDLYYALEKLGILKQPVSQVSHFSQKLD